jgi:hypothetical protein
VGNRKSLAALAVALACTAAAGATAAPLSPEFTPAFDGRTLNGWTPVGAARWSVANGEIAAAGDDGWLRLNRAFEDGRLKFRFNCAGCDTGILLRSTEAGQQTTGLYVSLAPDGFASLTMVTIGADGRIVDRKEAARGPAPASPFAAAAGAAGASGPPGAAGAAGRAPPAAGPPAGAPPGAGPGGEPPPAEPPLIANDWNYVSLGIRGGSLALTVNNRVFNLGAPVVDIAMYGRAAIAAAPGLRVTDIAFEDYVTRRAPTGRTGDGFQSRQIDSLFVSETTGIADVNKDGKPDIINGPQWFEGPDFVVSHEIDIPVTVNQGSGYPMFGGTEVFDWNGDGWPDILNQTISAGFPSELYINPRGENRHWDKFRVTANTATEIFKACDLFNDGRRVLASVVDGRLGWFAPGGSLTEAWVFHPVSEQGARRGARPGPTQHGLGCGDVNGDGRADLLSANGWWEQPATTGDALWAFHSAPWDVYTTTADGGGGAEMHVYDVNGDGRSDVVTGLRAHGWGMAWFEQGRDGGWTRHMIMSSPDKAQAESLPPISEVHVVDMADMDGDGLKDIITGKRWWSHGNLFREEGFQAPATLYWFKLSRTGGVATFTPREIHDRSGIGTDFAVGDVNGDGKPDIVTTARQGTWLFLNTMGAGRR